jgi:hypothetical protein
MSEYRLHAERLFSTTAMFAEGAWHVELMEESVGAPQSMARVVAPDEVPDPQPVVEFWYPDGYTVPYEVMRWFLDVAAGYVSAGDGGDDGGGEVGQVGGGELDVETAPAGGDEDGVEGRR